MNVPTPLELARLKAERDRQIAQSILQQRQEQVSIYPLVEKSTNLSDASSSNADAKCHARNGRRPPPSMGCPTATTTSSPSSRPGSTTNPWPRPRQCHDPRRPQCPSHAYPSQRRNANPLQSCRRGSRCSRRRSRPRPTSSPNHTRTTSGDSQATEPARSVASYCRGADTTDTAADTATEGHGSRSSGSGPGTGSGGRGESGWCQWGTRVHPLHCPDEWCSESRYLSFLQEHELKGFYSYGIPGC